MYIWCYFLSLLSEKQIIDLKRKINFTSTFSQGVYISYTHIIYQLLLYSLDEEDKEMLKMDNYYQVIQEIKPLEEEKPKPVDEDKPKPDISTHDKTLTVMEG